MIKITPTAGAKILSGAERVPDDHEPPEYLREVPPPTQNEQRPWPDDSKKKSGEGNGRNMVAALDWIAESPWADRIGFDEMHKDSSIEIDGSWCVIEDSHILTLLEEMQRDGLPTIAKNTAADAVNRYARSNPFHPVRDYLESLIWDGESRLRSWLHKALGAEDTPYTQEVGRWFLISMVARIMKPGCKVDTMLILSGEQGGGKSTAAEILAGEYFSDALPKIGSKDAQLHLRGKWVVEIAELDGFKKAEQTAIKAFLTACEDKYRAPYAVRESYYSRQCVFIGTTNERQFLRDATGARRFWPVEVGNLDRAWLEEARDQLFAEAFFALNEGAEWWPDKEFTKTHIAPIHEKAHEVHPWEEPIREWLTTRQDPFTIHDIFIKALSHTTDQCNRGKSNEAAAILRRLGYEQAKSNSKRVWRKPR